MTGRQLKKRMSGEGNVSLGVGILSEKSVEKWQRNKGNLALAGYCDTVTGPLSGAQDDLRSDLKGSRAIAHNLN